MRTADVALVAIARGAEDVMMPSKTYSAMVTGQAILAVCPLASDLAETALGNDCGWVVEPGDVEGLRHPLAGVLPRARGRRAVRLNVCPADRMTTGCRISFP
jgi:hypothetical protein